VYKLRTFLLTLFTQVPRRRVLGNPPFPFSGNVRAEDHPRAVYLPGLYFVTLARTLPALLIHHPLVFSKKLPHIPEADASEESGMQALHLRVRPPLKDRYA
jgi:hypothetical protein